MIDIVKKVVDIESAHSLHLARLIILIAEFEKQSEKIDGLSKLAKLDFFVRYPTLLAKALLVRGKSSKHLHIEDYEKQCVESAMVRYRFGPWDHRYRNFLNVLIAKGLVSVKTNEKKVVIMCTPLGMETAASFARYEEFLPYKIRSELVCKNFNYTSTNLTKFLFEIFPEILSFKHNAEITI